jgi:hypothetical protein
MVLIKLRNRFKYVPQLYCFNSLLFNLFCARSLAGGIHYIDGNYVSDDHTVTSLWGNNTRTFTDTIISITDQPNITDFMVALAPAPVPIPAAAWLFGSGLVGLISIARRNKA